MGRSCGPEEVGFPLRSIGLSLSGALCSVSTGGVADVGAVAARVLAGGEMGGVGFGVSDPTSGRAPDPGRRSTGGLS